jgi:hypothetical protein
VSRFQGVRGRSVVLVSVALLAWTAASRSGADPLFAASAAPDRTAAIESVPAPLVTTSDRPVIAGSGKRADGHRALSLAVGVLDGVVASIPVAWDVRLTRSLIGAGPVAFGLARRGPPAPSLP